MVAADVLTGVSASAELYADGCRCSDVPPPYNSRGGALQFSGIVTALMANCFAYWAGVSPPSDLFGLYLLYSRVQVSITRIA